MTSLKKGVGETIAILRKRHSPKLSQKDLASKVGVETTTVYRWEKGINYPDSSHIDALASALGVSAAEIVGGTPLKSPTTEALLEALSNLEKENKELREFELIIQMIKKKYTQKELSALAHAKDINLHAIKAIITGETSDLRKMLADMIAKRKSFQTAKGGEE